MFLFSLQINGGGEELPNGDCSKSSPKTTTHQNKNFPPQNIASSATPTSARMIGSSDTCSYKENTSSSDYKLSLENGIGSSSSSSKDEIKKFCSSGNSTAASSSSLSSAALNYKLSSTSSPCSSSSSGSSTSSVATTPESDLVLDSSSGLLVKKSDDLLSRRNNDDSPSTFELTGNNCNEVATMTEPDSLGPCEPGTAVKLQGIVWQETDKGMSFLCHFTHD